MQAMRLSCNALHQLFCELFIARRAALRYVALRHLTVRCVILCYAMLSYGLANAIWTHLKPLMLVPVCVCEINTHFNLACFLYVLTPPPRISKLPHRCRTAANENECLFHTPNALDVRMLVNIDIRGGGGSRMCTTSRMSVYFTHTGILANNC